MGRRGVMQAIRRAEREARKRAKDAAKAWAAAQKAQAADAARLEVEAFDAHLEELTSIHRECVEPVDWSTIERAHAPSQPEFVASKKARSARAKGELEMYRPSFFERLFGLTGRKLRLEIAVAKALSADAKEEAELRAEHAAAMARWSEAQEQWALERELARRVLERAPGAFEEAVESTGCLQELETTLGSGVLVAIRDEARADVVLIADADHVVPTEQKTLSAKSAVQLKKLPAARRMEIYQDYVCGAALRAAREIMSVVPVESVLVHVKANLLDTASGNMALRVILSVLCTRNAMGTVRWDRVDASDFVGTLTHRMKVTRGKGFVPVEPIGNTLTSA